LKVTNSLTRHQYLKHVHVDAEINIVERPSESIDWNQQNWWWVVVPNWGHTSTA